jgi:hypothetical protein
LKIEEEIKLVKETGRKIIDLLNELTAKTGKSRASVSVVFCLFDTVFNTYERAKDFEALKLFTLKVVDLFNKVNEVDFPIQTMNNDDST